MTRTLALLILGAASLITSACTQQRDPEDGLSAAPAGGESDAAIVTVIPEEYHAVLAHMDRVEPAPAMAGRPNLFSWAVAELDRPETGDPLRIVVALAGEAGTTSGALAVLLTAERWRPQWIVVAGIAGGMPGKVRRGDIVVSEAVWGYDYGALDAFFEPRQDWIFRSDETLIQAVRSVPSHWREAIRVPAPVAGAEPVVTLGVTGSGNKIIERLGSPFTEQIVASYPAVGSVEMEGAGAFAAAELLREIPGGPGVVMFRAISDIPEEPGRLSDKADRELWKRHAADAVAAFTAAFLRHSLPAPGQSARASTGVDSLILCRSAESFEAIGRRVGELAPGRTLVEGSLPSRIYGGEYRVAVQRLPEDASPEFVSRALEHWRPRYVLVSDIAVGMPGSNAGDVAVARMVWPYRGGGGSVEALRNQSRRSSRALLNAALGLAAIRRTNGDAGSPRTRFGALAAPATLPQPGEQPDMERIRELNARTIAMDAESGIVAEAVAVWQSRGNTVGLLSVQGIHRVAGEDSPADDRAAAAAAAAELSLDLIREAWPVPPAPRP